MTLMNQVELTLAAVIYIGALIHYGVFVRWWAHRTGRVLFSILLSLAIMTSFVAIVAWYPEWPYRAAARNLVYSLLLITSVIVWLGIIEGQAYGRRKANEFKLSRTRDAADKR